MGEEILARVSESSSRVAIEISWGVPIGTYFVFRVIIV